MFYRTYGNYEAINKMTYNDAHSSRLVHIDLNYWTPALFSRALDTVWNHFNINNICLMPICTTTNTDDDQHHRSAVDQSATAKISHSAAYFLANNTI